MSIFDELARSRGFYNARDMFDGGGAMARGGRFEGGGLLSMIGNLANSVLGRDMGRRSAYFAKKPMRRPMPMQNNAPPMVAPRVTSDPRNFARGTEPRMLTEAEKEALVMAQFFPSAMQPVMNPMLNTPSAPMQFTQPSSQIDPSVNTMSADFPPVIPVLPEAPMPPSMDTQSANILATPAGMSEIEAQLRRRFPDATEEEIQRAMQMVANSRPYN
jgi:hypothetical protein